MAQANVSPVSTQESLLPNESDGSLVSPIEPSFPTSTQAPPSEHGLQSHLPRRPNHAAAAKTPNEKIPRRWSLRPKKEEETRWDEYSGEPSDIGKPSSVRPGAAPALDPLYPQLKERTRQILAGLKEREAVKKSTFAKEASPIEQDPLDHPAQRPPWKGASGRHAIVEPVKNTPSARTRPLMLVERKKKTDEQAAAAARIEMPEEPVPTGKTPKSPIDAVSFAASTLPTVKSVSSDESLQPVAPLKGRNTTRTLPPVQAENIRALDSPFQSPGPAPAFYSAAPSPAPSSVQDYGADSPTLGSICSFAGPDRRPSEESVEVPVTPRPIEREPDTTSSWNTYATSTFEDKRQAPQSPIRPAELTRSPIMTSAAVSTPIMLRKRVAANNSAHRSYDNYDSIVPFSGVTGRVSSSSILRKAVTANEKPRAVSLMSGMSVTKSLPPTPVELQAADKVSSLEARLDDLSRRKRNVNKIVAELRDSLRRNAIIYDSRKRKEVDKMIINLNLELQDITNESHEVTLRLHRVQKRRDKDDFYEEPTGLWIKRVTT